MYKWYTPKLRVWKVCHNAELILCSTIQSSRTGPTYYGILRVPARYQARWSWECDLQTSNCRSTLNGNSRAHSTLELCQLVCGKTNYLNVWPYPTGAISSIKEIVLIAPDTIQFVHKGPQETEQFLNNVTAYFRDRIKTLVPGHCPTPLNHVTIALNSLRGDVSLTLDQDESYTLETQAVGDTLNIQIFGETVFGVRHGIETLLQLLVPYEEKDATCFATLKSVKIKDKPVYRHRGLLLDSARNYLSTTTIKKNIDGMAASKLNVLHWHITDSQSFPLQLPNLPNMTIYGAYSEKQTYKPDDIRDIAEYAKIRGVRILIEIDGPSHAGSGWQWGPQAGLGNLAVCINQHPWRSYCIQPPCGQLNPTNPHLYNTLGTLFKDVTGMVPDINLFHLGGDEVYIPCWNSTKEIIDYLKGKPRTEKTFFDLWGKYHRKALEAYDLAVGHNKTSAVVWTSHLTDPEVIQKYFPKERYIIQTWVPESSNDLITSLLKLGYRIIISTKDKWYLDHGFWGNTPFYTWRNVYENKMYDVVDPGILGGEVCMWGELVDDINIEPRVWPRAAAAAERLWTNPRRDSKSGRYKIFCPQRETVEERNSRGN
ncbi:hypothetical protein NQ318_016141 [Aromia moschata]|uniref:Beta-hexosaminidase n=1 Tax=Aromia moschata TaxID=1265417 RepID=A0AAV8Y1F1_9CUCU|nr:hypothetical protein NQ318_016141 [Aromia moschata]